MIDQKEDKARAHIELLERLLDPCKEKPLTSPSSSRRDEQLELFDQELGIRNEESL